MKTSTDACVSALKAEVAELKATVAALTERLEDIELTYVHNGKSTPRQIARRNAESRAEAERMSEYKEKQERENEVRRAEHEKRVSAAAAEEARRERETEERRASSPHKGESHVFERRTPFDEGRDPHKFQR